MSGNIVENKIDLANTVREGAKEEGEEEEEKKKGRGNKEIRDPLLSHLRRCANQSTYPRARARARYGA